MPATRDDYLDLLRRTTDSGWLDGLLGLPDSAALIEGLLAIAVQVGQSAEDGCNAGAISLAPGGRPGTCLLVLSRTVTTESFTVPAGYPFLLDGIVLEVQTDVLVPVGPSTFSLPLQTRRLTEAVNTFGDGPFPVGASGSAVSDPTALVVTDTGANDVLGPPGTAVISEVVSSTAVAFGASDWLSALGSERGQFRQAGETDEVYRLRVRNLPESVSPHGVIQSAQGVAQQQGLPPFTLYEPFDDGSDPDLDVNVGLASFASMFWWDDAAAYPPGGPTPPAPYMQVALPVPADAGTAADPLAGFFDDANAADDVIALMLSAREASAYFKLRANFAPNDFRNADSVPPGGAYYDQPQWTSPPTPFLLEEDERPELIGGLMAVYEEADRKRAGGVQFDLELPHAQSYAAEGGTLALVLTTVWTLTPPPGKFWQFDYIVVGHFGDPVQIPGQAHTVRFTFEDASTFETTAYTDVDSERITRDFLYAMSPPEAGRRVTMIEGRTTSDGVNTGRMTGFLRALEITSPIL